MADANGRNGSKAAIRRCSLAAEFGWLADCLFGAYRVRAGIRREAMEQAHLAQAVTFDNEITRPPRSNASATVTDLFNIREAMMLASLCLRQGCHELINEIDFVTGSDPLTDPMARALSIQRTRPRCRVRRSIRCGRQPTGE